MIVLAQGRLEVVQGEVIKNWGGWYRRDRVLLDGVELEGGLHTRRRPKVPQPDLLTIHGASCVRGHDLRWLVTRNGKEWPGDG